MIRPFAFFAMLFALLPLGAAATAAPVAPSKNATGSAQIITPSSLRKLQDLNFAYLAVTGAGTAVVNPDNDTMTTTGGVLRVGGTPYAAMFEAISPNKTVVIIRVPKTPITVTRVGGTETMTVSNWTLSGASKKTIKANEPFDFKVGGTLNVKAGQAEGVYIGNFDVELQYP